MRRGSNFLTCHSGSSKRVAVKPVAFVFFLTYTSSNHLTPADKTEPYYHSRFVSHCTSVKCIIDTIHTSLPVSMDEMIMLESSPPLTTTVLLSAEVTQMTGAIWALRNLLLKLNFIPGMQTGGWFFYYHIRCFMVSVSMSHTITEVSSDPVIR